MANESTACVTDLQHAVDNLSAAQKARGTTADGPNMDVQGNLNLVALKLREAITLLNLILYGNSLGTGDGSKGMLRSGDSNAADTTTKAVNVLAALA